MGGGYVTRVICAAVLPGVNLLVVLRVQLVNTKISKSLLLGI